MAYNINQDYTPLSGPDGLPVPAHTGPPLGLHYLEPVLDTIAGTNRPFGYGDVQVAWNN